MSLILVLSLMGTFIAVALASGAVAHTVLERQAPGRKRLRGVVPGRPATVRSTGADALTDRPNRTAERIASFVPKSPREMTKLHRRLVRAGYHSLTAAVVFSIAELVMPVVLGIPLVVLLDWPQGLIYGGLLAVVGFMMPSLVLGQLIDRRRLAITNGLPDVLDLLIVCLEAGCSLDQAIVKATEELYLVYPALGEELKMLTAETRAGKPRVEAFKNLDVRTGNDDVRALVAMMVQTDRFGTSVTQALRTFADVTRTKRRQRAEERAAQVGVKMVFPLVLFMFPALYVVILGAAVVQIFRAFLG